MIRASTPHGLYSSKTRGVRSSLDGQRRSGSVVDAQSHHFESHTTAGWCFYGPGDAARAGFVSSRERKRERCRIDHDEVLDDPSATPFTWRAVIVAKAARVGFLPDSGWVEAMIGTQHSTNRLSGYASIRRTGTDSY